MTVTSTTEDDATSGAIDTGAAHPDRVQAEAAAGTAGTEATLVEGDLLVEDVSIDGMCGVY